jgi:tetratricopeptide (TPR) repeat protein
LEFQSSPSTCFESLININKKLDQYDAAIGVLKVVLKIKHGSSSEKSPKDKGYTIQESWLAKLGQWNEALVRYDQRLVNNPQETVALLGKLKCLDALVRKYTVCSK